ncbi:hypothetical protein Val02_62880 [Virgisporangium aliadipatigenens]|uniref:Uncharacterized protein n=1 Tax=Virgisporangium aliadipatigenens TaxID=741659 RepID=A0A8J3YRY7_9ACTN|nr:hypothetical protein [Virgisporangium aliadipatigenens]GIJ49402.1 hypothetical protein Val02_62880 [Virgisporangium aliadipatigenens]
MKIDKNVEPLVRKALAAAVKRDPDLLATALRAFPNDDAIRRGSELAIAVAGLVAIDIHSGRPTDSELRTLAQEIADSEAWAGFSADDVYTFLATMFAGRPVAEVLTPEKVSVLIFLVPATLLSAFRREDENWWDHLDRAEAAIEREQQ